MSRDERPRPEDLLAAISEQDARANQGRLRLFLGMSAGVGKTCAMLQAAHQRRSEGVDVVVGFVETHGRAETLRLSADLPQIPRRKLEYRGTGIEEMDLEAIIARRPALVLVDELAHTNAPGSRHEKRYQDVIELLELGFDVYSTLNVQHLESRKEAVEAIAQIQIRETVPDSILERAHLVEVVDIAPPELLKRLREGKIYAGDKAVRAEAGFFKEDRLTALREIALRLTAERVDRDLTKLAREERRGPWDTNERLMAAVSHSPHSERLIRATRRLAYRLDAPWIAVYVDSGARLQPTDHRQLRKNLNLARELGAEVVRTSEVDVVAALTRVARQRDVTQIVVGRPPVNRLAWLWPNGRLVDRLISCVRDVDLHVIRQGGENSYFPPLLRRLPEAFGSFVGYWSAFWAVGLTGLLGGLVEPLIGYRAVGFLFLLGVLLVGLAGAVGPVLFAAFLSAVGWNFFFIPPRMTFNVSRPDDSILCVCYFVVASIVGFLTHRVRTNERLIREREDRTSVLLAISRDIAGSRDRDEFLSRVVSRVGQLLDGTCAVVLRGEGGKLESGALKTYSMPLNEKEFAVATWAFERGQPAGWSTETLAQAKGLYLPLKTHSGVAGVLVFVPGSGQNLTVEQETLLNSITGQLAVALDARAADSA